ncbi:MAG: VanZ family protein [Clostridium argentinense]|uniref:VanZ family protein n=1 Tax=Clostridium faecium TaxID=2762223 RepID=A0ABR8YTA5_9CLOT|nr:VanZ family protein [Clostridium faecium]MBD8047503.1 VanZ family protein [Clostridium faecium]MBS5822923.1 VanZ family protein [Clostridium argentinense]
MKKAGKILLYFYFIVLIWILLFKFSVSLNDILNRAFSGEQLQHINLIPFGASGGVKEIVYNIIIFVPLGILIEIVNKKSSMIRNVIYILLFSLFIEVSQSILAVGATDITDLLTNTLGGILGILIYTSLRKVFNSEKLDVVLIVIGIVILVLTTVLLLFLVFVMGIRIKFLG